MDAERFYNCSLFTINFTHALRYIIGPPPTDEHDCSFVSLDASPPHVVHYTGEDGGKTAHYLLRWHMSNGGVGAWSETVSATITA